MRRLWLSSYPWATGLATVVGVVIAVMIVGDRWQDLSCDGVFGIALIPSMAWVIAIASGIGTAVLWRRRRVLAWSLGCGGLTVLVCVFLLGFSSVFACAIG